jgi:hypothetical protein
MKYTTIIGIKTINPVILYFQNNNVPQYFIIKNAINPHISQFELHQKWSKKRKSDKKLFMCGCQK